MSISALTLLHPVPRIEFVKDTKKIFEKGVFNV